MLLEGASHYAAAACARRDDEVETERGDGGPVAVGDEGAVRAHGSR